MCEGRGVGGEGTTNRDGAGRHMWAPLGFRVDGENRRSTDEGRLSALRVSDEGVDEKLGCDGARGEEGGVDGEAHRGWGGG